MTDPRSPSRDPQLLARLGQVLAPAYDVESEIGRGGMAIVYRARDPRLKRGVAVKLLPPELAFRDDIRSRFLREAEMAARLSHPNIVPIYTVDEREGLVYFVMALVEGESVGDRLRRVRTLSVSETRNIVREVSDALAYAHRLGVVHRDIKPDNVLLDRHSGRAMVTDFGIARAVSDDGGGGGLTATGAAIGTPAYMSPEQCTGERAIDGRSDLYSLGAVAYQMLSGAPPFSAGGTAAIMVKQVTEIPVSLRQRRPDVPDDLDRIVMRLLEKDPRNRFDSGAMLVAALDGAPVAPISRPPVTLTPVGLRPAPAPERPLWDDPRLSRRERKRLARNAEIERKWAAKKAEYERKQFAKRAEYERKQFAKQAEDNRPIDVRIRSARKHVVSYLSTSLFLVGLNAATSDFWWSVFPILGMGLGIAKEIGGLWADGVPPKALLTGPFPAPPELGSPQVAPNLAAFNAPRSPAVRQAASDLHNVRDLVGRLTDAERKLIPDVTATAESLWHRIGALSSALERMDDQIGTDRLPAVEERIARAEQSTDTGPDRDRRLMLLRRQRDTLADLVRARTTLRDQLESATLMLQNLALDVLKVRSSGLDSALADITSATQEARALSREIGYVLSAAEELRDIGPPPRS